MNYIHYSISISDDSTSTTSRSSNISLNSSMKISNRLIVDGVDMGPTAKDRLRELGLKNILGSDSDDSTDSTDSTDSSDDDSI